MPVIRFRANSSRSVVQVIADSLDSIGRPDLADAILATDELTIQTSEIRFDFVSVGLSPPKLGCADCLMSGPGSKKIAEEIVEDLKFVHEQGWIDGIVFDPEAPTPPNEPAWRITSRVTYWKPVHPIQTYPGFDPEPPVPVQDPNEIPVMQFDQDGLPL